MSNVARNASEHLVKPKNFPRSTPPSIVDDSPEDFGCSRKIVNRRSRAQHVDRGMVWKPRAERCKGMQGRCDPLKKLLGRPAHSTELRV